MLHGKKVFTLYPPSDSAFLPERPFRTAAHKHRLVWVWSWAWAWVAWVAWARERERERGGNGKCADQPDRTSVI